MMTLVNLQLNDVECRDLGSLIEKEITTPEYYPLSLNALVGAASACTLSTICVRSKRA